MTFNYDKSDQFYEKQSQPVMCGCMGPVYGEPFCPCRMAELGLPMSRDNVEAQERTKGELDAFLRQYGWQ